MAKVTLEGNEFNTNGDLPAVGSAAPDFKLTTGELNDVTLADYKGKKKLLNIVGSLDTSTCVISARKFNDYAKEHDDTVILVISADLPFAQGRVCTGEKLDNVIPLSMMRDKNFAKDYGILIQDGPITGLISRSVVVLDENDKVVYTQLVPEFTNEPDYDSALKALG
jgi:thiol peroxidase